MQAMHNSLSRFYQKNCRFRHLQKLHTRKLKMITAKTRLSLHGAESQKVAVISNDGILAAKLKVPTGKNGFNENRKSVSSNTL
jgi:hypothetical protein